MPNHPYAPYVVSVVLDRAFGGRLEDTVAVGPVWIIDTPSNRVAAQAVWDDRPGATHLDGVTLFKSSNATCAEDSLVSHLDTIDLHHSIYSADPPYTELIVFGCSLTERLRAELETFGFDSFEATPDGFKAVRPLPAADVEER